MVFTIISYGRKKTHISNLTRYRLPLYRGGGITEALLNGLIDPVSDSEHGKNE